MELTRRSFVRSAAAISAVAGLSPVIGRTVAYASEPVRWASLTPGFTVLVTEYIRYHKLDEKNGFKLAEPINYTSVPTYYGDFVAGNYDVCIGSWDTFATRYLSRVPIKLLCNISTAQMINIMAPKDGAKSVADLRGKTLAAPQSTGTYRMVRAVVQDVLNIDIEKDMRVQNVTNPATSVTLLRASSVEGALSWEPNITNVMKDAPNLHVIFNAGDAYKSKYGHDLPYFGVGVTDALLKKNPKVGEQLNNVFKDCINGILADVPGAVKIVGERTGFAPTVLQEAISSRRLSFKFSSMRDEDGRKSVMAAAKFLATHKLLSSVPDSGFFA